MFICARGPHNHRGRETSLLRPRCYPCCARAPFLKTQHTDLHSGWCRGRPMEGELTSLSSFLKISLASSKEHCSSLHSLSREPAFSSSRNELARLCLCKTPWASLWVMKTEKWEFHEAFATHHSKMAQKPSTLVSSHSAIGVKGFLSTGLAE